MVYYYSFHVKPPNSECDHKSIIIGMESTNLIGLQEAKNWVLILSDPVSSSLTLSCGEVAITLDNGPASLFGATKIMLMVPNGGHAATFHW